MTDRSLIFHATGNGSDLFAFWENSSQEKLLLRLTDLYTPSIAEIMWVKNVRAIVVCGFLI